VRAVNTHSTKDDVNMKTRLLIVAAVIALSGCDTNDTLKKDVDALNNRLTAVEKSAADAMSAARDAQGQAAQAASAKATADAAMAAAQEASERAKRISETCCTRK
jgi:outer membrane lipoprotein SlyB